MRPLRTMLCSAAVGSLLALCPLGSPLFAETPAVRVAVDEVSDDRYGAGPGRSAFELKIKLSGDGMDGVQGVRFRVKEARDDVGNALVPDGAPDEDFENPESNLAQKIVLKSPARKASAVSLSGTVDLFAPKRDPNAVVTVEKAFARLNEPLKAKGLKAAKVEVSVLSKERYAEELKKQKPTEKELAGMRAEAKKQGASDAEIEAGLALLTGLADAFGDVSENGVILSGPRAGMELIESVLILGPDGEENHVSSSSKQGNQKTVTMILEPDGKLEPNSSLRFTLLTEKARFTVPFALKEVPLP